VDLLSRTEGLLRSLSAEVLDELQGIDLAAWDGAELPPLGWIVTDWMPRGDVTSLYGRGGAGKSFLAQLLGSCVQFGKPFLGLEIEPCQVLGVFCEDGWDDLLWRQQKIDRALEISWRDGRFPLWISRRGKVNALMTFEHGGLPRMTPLFAAIREKAKRIGARLIILDNVAHLYAGDEISRHEVTTFLNMFAGLAEEINGAVLLIGHPPAIEGKEYSGSTAWVNQVRALWTFEKSKTEDGKYLLKRFKCNRSGEDKLELVKDEITGVVRPDHPDFEDLETRRQREKRAGRCRQHILEHLDILNSRGDCASHSPNAKNYLPRLLKTSTCTAAFTRTRWQWLSRASLPMAGFPRTSRSAGVPTGTRSWAWLGHQRL
jgi:AAA domain